MRVLKCSRVLFMLSSATTALLLATPTFAFVPSSTTRTSFSFSSRTRHHSVRLPQDAELLKQATEAPPLSVVEEPLLQEVAIPSTSSRTPKKSKGPVPVVVLEGDILESTMEHKSLVATHYLLTLAALNDVVNGFDGHISALDGFSLAAVAAYSVIFSDFFSGVFHWSVDNYGNGKTPIMGGIIEAFQGHHDAPWTITHRSFANNVHKITKITIPTLVAMLLFWQSSPFLTLFMTIFLNLQVLSQEFHKLSHLSKPPAWAAWLQDNGLIISRKEHGQHHSNPFESNYCILMGFCNKYMDESGLYRKLEKVLYETTGAVPNCWKLGPEVRQLALTGSSSMTQEERQVEEE